MKVNNISVYRLQPIKFNQTFGCKDCEQKNNSANTARLTLASLFAAAAVSLMATSENLSIKNFPGGTKVDINELEYTAPSAVKIYNPMDVYRRKRDENVMPFNDEENNLGTATLDVEG